MDNAAYYEEVTKLIAQQLSFVSVILVDANGSIPQEVGAKMLVTAKGLCCGTVGGGKVEKKAIDEAIALLGSSSTKTTHFVNWSLSRDVGMTCGGSVKLYFETHNHARWNITIFGAGHIAQALMDLLLKLECLVTCIDPRQEWLDRLPESPKLKKILETDMPSRVTTISPDSFVLMMTMGHSSDKPILLEILRRGLRFPYMGIIGSDAKAAQLKKDIVEAGLDPSLAKTYYCPMGLDIGSNHPQEIAISIIAQLLQERDRVRVTEGR
jgi:xanthine dehydrogenase accessory factor